MSKSSPLSRRSLLIGLGVTVAAVGVGAIFMRSDAPRSDLEGAELVVYKSPTCGCCGKWVDHMRASGFTVAVHDMDDLTQIKAKAGVPGNGESCHTAFIDGYAIEGHVPASDVRRLLAERPEVKGLTVPGMPQSAPGMDSPGEPYTVLTFGGTGGMEPFASH